MSGTGGGAAAPTPPTPRTIFTAPAVGGVYIPATAEQAEGWMRQYSATSTTIGITRSIHNCLANIKMMAPPEVVRELTVPPMSQYALDILQEIERALVLASLRSVERDRIIV